MKGKITAAFNKNICRRILTHLKSKVDHRDNLDGILLGIYEQEIQRLSNRIFRNLGYLISIGTIVEVQNADGSTYYRLIDNQREIEKLLCD